MECWHKVHAPTVAHSLLKISLREQHGLFSVIEKKSVEERIIKARWKPLSKKQGLAYSCSVYFKLILQKFWSIYNMLPTFQNEKKSIKKRTNTL